MYQVTLVLHDPDLLEEVVAAWREAGVQGATVLFSTGMGRIHQKEGLRDDIPLIPSLDDFYEAPQTLGRTIFTVIQDEALIDKILAATQKIVGDLEESDTGVLLVAPLLRAYGVEKKKGKK